MKNRLRNIKYAVTCDMCLKVRYLSYERYRAMNPVSADIKKQRPTCMSCICKNLSNVHFKKGTKPWNYRKGKKTSELQIARNSIENLNWIKAIKERDNYTCQECFATDKKVVADHIKNFAHYPELRYEMSNGRTLCEGCHRKTSNYGRAATLQKIRENDL